MSRIVHLSLKVDDVEKTGDFYKDVFGFTDAETRRTRDHLSRHMTDGAIDFTLMRYDEGTRSAESRASGDGPCIHHFAVEVEDIPEGHQAHQGARLHDHQRPGRLAGQVPRSGGHRRRTRANRPLQAAGTAVQGESHRASRPESRRAGEDRDFYKEVFGFRDTETKKTRDHTSRHMTDGTIDFTLLKYDAGTQSAEPKASGEGPCIHHFAIEVPDMARATEQIKRYGSTIVSDPGVIPVKFRAPGGTVAELVPLGRYKT